MPSTTGTSPISAGSWGESAHRSQAPRTRNRVGSSSWRHRPSASSITSRTSRARRRRSCSRIGSSSIKLADEAGFAGFHLAEHHGSDLCMAPNQEVFIAAASQVTKNIRLGPMVKLLPLHHPVQIIEDMCVVDQLTGGRLDFGVGRGRGADRALLVRQHLAGVEAALRGHARHHLRRVRDRRDQQREQRVLRLPDDPARRRSRFQTRSRSGTRAARSPPAATA
jgi:alkanesulfonate monooxygenase SsuD/methylene tetrahydromethanopterin reductase-like flavin-dependent oxidoreductase (luciferase family)